MPRKSQFNEEQIIRALKEVDAGAKPADVCRRLGVTERGTSKRADSALRKHPRRQIQRAPLTRAFWRVPSPQRVPLRRTGRDGVVAGDGPGARESVRRDQVVLECDGEALWQGGVPADVQVLADDGGERR
jgi:hypothetical protein